jgi:hypothetical protein
MTARSPATARAARAANEMKTAQVLTERWLSGSAVWNHLLNLFEKWDGPPTPATNPQLKT